MGCYWKLQKKLVGGAIGFILLLVKLLKTAILKAEIEWMTDYFDDDQCWGYTIQK